MQITATIENVTPKLAETLLGSNFDRQRHKASAHIDSLVGEMERGTWSATANPIQIADTGKIINGQHRLNAVVRYGKPVKMLFLRGQPESDFKHIDTKVKPRDGVDMATIEGYAHARELMPQIQYLRNYHESSNPMTVAPAKRRLAPYELMKWGYDTHGDALIEALDEFKSMGRDVSKVFKKRPLLWCYYQAKQVDEELAYAYISYLVNPYDHDPINATHKMIRKHIEQWTVEQSRNGLLGRMLFERQIPMIRWGWCLLRANAHRTKVFWSKADQERNRNRFDFDYAE